jgi:hypothetical protein
MAADPMAVARIIGGKSLRRREDLNAAALRPSAICFTKVRKSSFK